MKYEHYMQYNTQFNAPYNREVIENNSRQFRLNYLRLSDVERH